MNTLQALQITNFAELLKLARSLYSKESTFKKWQAFKDMVINEADFLKSIINKETIPTLKRYTYRADNKKQAVSNVFNSIAQCAILSDTFSYSPFDETSEQAYKRITDGYNEGHFLAYRAEIQAKAEAREKALNDPQTLDEFRQFISRKGESALSEEQRVKYDELTADTRRAIKEREEQSKAIIKTVENVTAGMEIKESYHAKKNIPLWVVVLNDRVERATYEELNNRAKKLGGYYSSYRGNGAIAGFTFDNIEAAQLFTQVKEGDVNATELKQEAEEEKKQTRAEALKDKANKVIESGQEDLNKDRQDNTHRRATMATNAENRASAQIQFGKTLLKIAEAMESGDIKYLDKISNGKDLEQLNSILNMARNKDINTNRLKREDYKTTAQTVNFATLPHPVLYAHMKRDIEAMKESNGKKLASARMLKRFGSAEFILIDTPQRIEDYEILFCRPCVSFPAYRVERYKEDLMAMKRLKRMGIDTIEELRASLRELIALKEGTTISPGQKRALQIKELERQFIGTKIDGFFPTPANLAAQIVELADIQEGETVLEPSAGLGHLADEIKAQVNNELQCIEYNSRLAEALILKGYNVINEDFLSHTAKYDKIVMNPPFENGQDIKHVVHAFNLLNKGGRVVAIMANNKHRYEDFLGIVNTFGTMEENPDNSFASAFRPTGVSTITVILDKP